MKVKKVFGMEYFRSVSPSSSRTSEDISSLLKNNESTHKDYKEMTQLSFEDQVQALPLQGDAPLRPTMHQNHVPSVPTAITQGLPGKDSKEMT